MIHGAFFFASDVCPVREKMDMCVVRVYEYHGRAVTAFSRRRFHLEIDVRSSPAKMERPRRLYRGIAERQARLASIRIRAIRTCVCIRVYIYIYIHIYNVTRRICTPRSIAVAAYVSLTRALTCLRLCRVPAALSSPAKRKQLLLGTSTGIGNERRKRKVFARARIPVRNCVSHIFFLDVRVPASSHRPVAACYVVYNELKYILLCSARARSRVNDGGTSAKCYSLMRLHLSLVGRDLAEKSLRNCTRSLLGIRLGRTFCFFLSPIGYPAQDNGSQYYT